MLKNFFHSHKKLNTSLRQENQSLDLQTILIRKRVGRSLYTCPAGVLACVFTYKYTSIVHVFMSMIQLWNLPV